MKDKIQEDTKVAMKAGEKEKVTILRGLLAEIKRGEIDTKSDFDEAKCVAVIQKEIKKRRDAIEFAEKASREDLISQNKSEIAVLQSYLGEQLSEDELRGLISKLIEGGAANIGAIMGALNKDHKGKFEGKLASQIAKEVLG